SGWRYSGIVAPNEPDACYLRRDLAAAFGAGSPLSILTMATVPARQQSAGASRWPSTLMGRPLTIVFSSLTSRAFFVAIASSVAVDLGGRTLAQTAPGGPENLAVIRSVRA